MKAIILAAGMGIRLGVLTKQLPKCLIEIDGKTLLEYSLDTLKENNIKKAHDELKNTIAEAKGETAALALLLISYVYLKEGNPNHARQEALNVIYFYPEYDKLMPYAYYLAITASQKLGEKKEEAKLRQMLKEASLSLPDHFPLEFFLSSY